MASFRWHVTISLVDADSDVEMWVEAEDGKAAVVEALSMIELEPGELIHTIHVGAPAAATRS